VPLALYFDEDSMDDAQIGPLRSRGLDVLTALQAGQLGREDEAQLAFATARSRILVTRNIQDFFHLHTLWLTA
jgi:hypothetical protein